MIQNSTQEEKTQLNTPKEDLSIYQNYTTEENALIIKNYPYGFRLKTDIKYWIETKNNKQRFCSMTLNPKSNKWNKAKYGVYCDLILMYKEKETGHIKNYSYNIYGKEEYNKLLEFLQDYRNPYIENVLKLSRAVFETQKHIKVTIRETQFKHKVTGEIKTRINIFELNDYEEITEEEHEQKQKEISKSINKLFVVNALNEGLSVEEIRSLK